MKRSSGSVRAAFSRSGKARVLVSTAAGHGNRGARPGRSSRRLARAYPLRRKLARGLFAAGPRSTRIVGLRAGKVRFTGVASRALIARPRVLRRYLRLAGVR